MKKRLKVNGVIIFSATCIALAFPKIFFRPDSIGVFNDFSEVFGFAFILFGLLLRISARGYKSEHSEDGHILVLDGPYSLVRNPMYLGISMIGIGVVLVLFQWWAGIVFIFIFVVRYVLLIFKEEKHLVSQFGEVYKNYMELTPRLLPRLEAIVTREIREILPLKLSWVRKEIGSVAVFILGILVIESWQDIYREGPKVYLKEFIAFFLILGLFSLIVIYLGRGYGKRIYGIPDKSKDFR